MFDHIVYYYQQKIYSNHNRRPFRNMKRREKIANILLIVISLIYIIVALLENLVGILVCFILLMAIMFWVRWEWNKRDNVVSQINRIKEKKIGSLNTFLIDIAMDDRKSIKWLIKMCEKRLKDEKLEVPIVTFFTLIICPLITTIGTVFTTAYFANMSKSQITYLFMEVLLLSVLLIIIFWVLYPDFKRLTDKDKYVVEALENDLEYILLNFKTESKLN